MRLFQRSASAELFLTTLSRYRDQSHYELHGFVVMPDHSHLLLSPSASLEATVGLIKGGFSFAVRKQYNGAVWQEGYYSHRVMDAADYASQFAYIAANPERKRYKEFAYVHTNFSDRLDPKPPHLGG